RLPESKPSSEAVDELRPMCERVWAASLRESEGRNVESEHLMVSSEQGPHLVPNPTRLGGAAEQDDRRPGAAPPPVREQRPVDADERTGVELLRRLVAPVRREVVDKRRDREG